MSSPAISPARAAAARANGAKSRGPITPEGRARSSQNALSHGLTSQLSGQLSAREVTLHGEDPAAFDQFRASYLDRFQPADQPELDLVESMALSRWRLRRIAMLEVEVFETTHFRNQVRIKNELDEDAPFNAPMGWVFMEASKGKSLNLLLRYEGQLTRTYERSLKALQTLQKARASQPKHELQNEPKPARLPPSPATERPYATPLAAPSRPPVAPFSDARIERAFPAPVAESVT